MTTLAIVPIQHLTLAKSRLRHRLASSERRNLVINLLHHVLMSLGASALVDETVVVTPDPSVMQAVTVLGQSGLLQTGVGLNAAIRQGRDEAVRRGAEKMLVVLGDLPLLTSADIHALLDGVSESSIVLAPDRHQRGTNALVLCPANVLDPMFGPDSLQAHRSAAMKRGLHVREYRAIGTGFDLDEGIDLDELQHMYSRDWQSLWISERSCAHQFDFPGSDR